VAVPAVHKRRPFDKGARLENAAARRALAGRLALGLSLAATGLAIPRRPARVPAPGVRRRLARRGARKILPAPTLTAAGHCPWPHVPPVGLPRWRLARTDSSPRPAPQAHENYGGQGNYEGGGHAAPWLSKISMASRLTRNLPRKVPQSVPRRVAYPGKMRTTRRHDREGAGTRPTGPAGIHERPSGPWIGERMLHGPLDHACATHGSRVTRGPTFTTDRGLSATTPDR
jgi:hypothetical protein